MDRLRTMESFVRVARSGGFTTAATQLGISRALVSRHVTDLERRLGVRLLNRSTRWLALTDHGQRYLEFCERILSDLAKNERSLVRRESDLAGTLRVVVPKSFGCLNLADAVVAFAQAHPHVQIVITLDDYAFLPYDFVERGFDLAIRSAVRRDSALVSRQIATLEWIVCASPTYVARNGAPQAPADLAEHACISHFHPQSIDRDWTFQGPGGRISIRIESDFVTNSALLARKAALAGLGVALLPRYAAAGDLRTGALRRLLPQYEMAERLALAVYPRTVAAPHRVKLFIDFLTAWFARNDPNAEAPPGRRGPAGHRGRGAGRKRQVPAYSGSASGI